MINRLGVTRLLFTLSTTVALFFWRRIRCACAETRRKYARAGFDEAKRFRETLEFFEKYGGKYGFDPLMLAAQGYQESQLS
jgi:hypothetical protein